MREYGLTKRAAMMRKCKIALWPRLSVSGLVTAVASSANMYMYAKANELN